MLTLRGDNLPSLLSLRGDNLKPASPLLLRYSPLLLHLSLPLSSSILLHSSSVSPPLSWDLLETPLFCLACKIYCWKTLPRIKELSLTFKFITMDLLLPVCKIYWWNKLPGIKFNLTFNLSIYHHGSAVTLFATVKITFSGFPYSPKNIWYYMKNIWYTLH